MRVRTRSAVAIVTSLAFVASSVSAPQPLAGSHTGCPGPYPIEIGWQPGAVAAASEILVCTDAGGSAVWFYNEGDFVWRITAVGGASVTQHTETFEAEARRAAIADVYDYDVLGPDTWLTVHAYPSDVRIYPDDDLSALWWTHELLTNVITDEVEDWATLTALQRSRAVRTLATCSIAAADAVDDLGTLRTDDDGLERLLAASGLTSSVGTCARSWARLTDKVDELPPWRRGVISLTRSADFLDDADAFFTQLNTLRKLVPRLR